jgi:hypothetical protein
LTTSRRSVLGGRRPPGGGSNNDRRISLWASVRSVSYTSRAWVVAVRGERAGLFRRGIAGVRWLRSLKVLSLIPNYHETIPMQTFSRRSSFWWWRGVIEQRDRFPTQARTYGDRGSDVTGSDVSTEAIAI